ncbi:MAG: helix-hairpin-helix domain-containing protein [Acidobacteria bacterium]|nr:helix-hairpin-helix domain-containing protein [Acidobacteriota bacterium]
MRLSVKYLLWAALLPAAAFAQFPDGPGKAEFVKVCTGCHELERSAAMHQDRDGWKTTVEKMLALGAKGSDQEIAATIDYLARTFPAEEMPKLNVNTATQIEFESRFTLKRSEAAAIIKYREKNGPFKSIDDFKKIPGIDAARIIAKKDRITF